MLVKDSLALSDADSELKCTATNAYGSVSQTTRLTIGGITTGIL